MNDRIKFALKYFRYWLFAKHKRGHGIHSPFVFELITQVLNNKTVTKDLKKIFDLHDLYKKSNTLIEYDEIGAGSNYKASKNQAIGQIIKRSSVNKKYGQLLFHIVQYFKPKDILELGTSVGISAAYLAQAAPDSNFKTIDGIEAKIEIAKQISLELNQNTQFIVADLDQELETILESFEKLDFVFFDGNHKKENTIKYFKACLNKSHKDSVFVFDDIHWSNEMEEAWNIIKKHERVKLSIDLFSMGLILFKKELSYEQYIIKF